jgi:hypothetical protein
VEAEKTDVTLNMLDFLVYSLKQMSNTGFATVVLGELAES